MKTSERHHLKDNDFALALGSAQEWYTKNQQMLLVTIGAIVIVGGGVGGYMAWKGSTDTKARGMLAAAMVIEEARVQPPGPPAGTTNDPAQTPGQAPGTYPTEQAKHEAALPKFLAAADAYPTSDSGLMARYYGASTLVSLGRFDEAIKQYDQVIASGTGVLSRMSRMGKAEAQLRAKQFEPGDCDDQGNVGTEGRGRHARRRDPDGTGARLSPRRQDRGREEDLHPGGGAARRLAVRGGSEGRTGKAES